MGSSRDRDRESHRDERSRSRSTERDILEICWKPVREDPSNFDAWTHLLQCIEQMDETKPAREAYDQFLARYPNCYGYWRKYAELERRHKHIEKCIEVYERGVTAIPLSCDLWLSYLEFYKDYVKESEVRERRIRYLYERAITSCGLEFRSDKLWEGYLEWELKNKRYQEVLSLYDRVLKIPTLLYSTHFDHLQQFVNSYPPDKILMDTEYATYYKDIEVQMKGQGQEVYVVEEVPLEELEVPDEVDGDVKPRLAEYRKRYNDEALKLFRVAILDKRRKIHLYNEQEVSKRWNYEEGIKRPYFHVKPLERAQLKNWRAYLDYEIGEGIHERIVTLFERCLIACALYEDMWLRYARYLEKKDVEAAREVYKRACGVHLPTKPSPHLAWSALEERHGKEGRFEAAKAVLMEFSRLTAGLVCVQLRLLGIERRQALAESSGGVPEFADLSAKYERLLRDPKIPGRVVSFYAIKFARFQAKVRKDKRLAEKVLLDALNRDKLNGQLYLQLVDLALSQEPLVEEEVVSQLDRALHSELPDGEKIRFSQRKLEFLEEFGNDVTLLQEHFEYHQKLLKSTGVSSGKRKATSEAGKSEEKRVRTDGESNQQDYSAYYNSSSGTYYYSPQQSQNQGYNYNQYGNYYYASQY